MTTALEQHLAHLEAPEGCGVVTFAIPADADSSFSVAIEHLGRHIVISPMPDLDETVFVVAVFNGDGSLHERYATSTCETNA